MRLWCKDLVKYLPRLQLLSQWRECKCIAKNIKEHGTPNHILVNKIMDYDLSQFCQYSIMVYNEMKDRGYKVNENVALYIDNITEHHPMIYPTDLFKDWHNERYLRQCLLNLQEKYDCDAIPEKEWQIIYKKFKKYL